MSTIKEINSRIQTELASRQEVTSPGNGLVGTVLSKPGTEKIMLETSTLILMECEASVKGVDKVRYCIVDKTSRASYGNQFVTSTGMRAHIVTRELFNILLTILHSATRQIRELTAEKTRMQSELDANKLVLDVLRKNGVID